MRMSAKELVSRWRQDHRAGSVTTHTPQKRKFESPSEAPEVALQTTPLQAEQVDIQETPLQAPQKIRRTGLSM